MTSNPTNPKVSSGSVPRARAAPQPTTGMTDNQQRQTGSPSRTQQVQVCRHQGPLSRSHGHTADDPMLIRGKIQSRFRSSAQHFVYILIDRAEEGIDSVSSYTCSCPQGLRTVGCCAHIATVLWYLGYARHLPEIPIPADFLNDVCVELDEGQE